MSNTEDIKLLRKVSEEISNYSGLRIQFPVKEINPGDELSKSQASMSPTFHADMAEGKYYTLIMADPDAPSAEDPRFGPWLHLIRYNIAASSKGTDLVPYNGPMPPRGIHRYVFLLCEQPGQFSDKDMVAPKSSANFRLLDFIKKHGLKIVSANYFRTAAGSR